MPQPGISILPFFVPVLLALPVPAISQSDASAGKLPTESPLLSPSGQNAFSLPLANITRENRRAHVIGNSFFNRNWVISPASARARDGLGPLFLARSCSECHLRDGRSAPVNPGLLFRTVSVAEPGMAEPTPDPEVGTQIATAAIPGMEPEGRVEISYTEIPGSFGDGTTYTLRKPTYRFTSPVSGREIRVAPRIASPVFGLGLMEAIPENSLLAGADPDDDNGDGISGRPNFVVHPGTGKTVPGRFGWKANQPDLRHQTASAFVDDIGITSSIHPIESLTRAQREQAGPAASEPELDDRTLDRVVVYLKTLAAPAQRTPDDAAVREGDKLFSIIGCATCHVEEWRTAATVEGFPELSDQTIRPYTDLLLHDMGPGLADGRPDSGASGSEWRTAPLWGIGLTKTVNGHTFFLHDGRARNIEEAILWHGGEAEASKEAYRELPAEERAALLAFLHSL